jgi:hypothetical protein
MSRASHRTTRIVQVSALAAAALSLLTGCGGSARDGARDDEPAVSPEPDEEPVPNQEAPLPDEPPRPFVFPEGGGCLPGVPQQSVSELEVDSAGALWLRLGERLVVIHDGVVRSYGAPVQPLPFQFDLFLDAQDRVWLRGAGGAPDNSIVNALVVVDEGQWRPVRPERDTTLIGVSVDGSAWVFSAQRVGGAFEGGSGIQRVAPDVSEEIAPPRDYGGFNVAADGSVWMFAEDGVLRWSDGAWSGPFAGTAFNYDPRQNVMWLPQGRGLLVFDWTGSSLESRLLGGAERGNFIGFAPGLRQVWQFNRDLTWIEDGNVVGTMDLPSSLPVSLGPGGRVYQSTLTGIYREEDGVMQPIVTYLAPGETGASCP